MFKTAIVFPNLCSGTISQLWFPCQHSSTHLAGKNLTNVSHPSACVVYWFVNKLAAYIANSLKNQQVDFFLKFWCLEHMTSFAHSKNGRILSLCAYKPGSRFFGNTMNKICFQQHHVPQGHKRMEPFSLLLFSIHLLIANSLSAWNVLDAIWTW